MQSPRSKKLAANWFIGVLDDKKETFEQAIRASTTMKDALKTIIDKQIAEISQAETKTDQYDTPSWAYLQAHRNGQLGALRGILTLLDY